MESYEDSDGGLSDVLSFLIRVGNCVFLCTEPQWGSANTAQDHKVDGNDLLRSNIIMLLPRQLTCGAKEC